jgi:ADP-heptose:LPS heptosyltransferase
MKTSTMRFVDAWVGLPACWALTAVRKLADLFGARPSPSTVRRILFVKPAEQGATVLACPAIRRAVRMVGRQNVFFLVFAENRFILDVMGLIPRENVLTIPTSGLGALLTGLAAAWRGLRRLKIDAAVDLELFARSSAVLTCLSGARVRVGLHRFDEPAPRRGDLMTHRIRFDGDLHAGQLFDSMVQAIERDGADLKGAKLPPPPLDRDVPPFIPTQEELSVVRAKLLDQSHSFSGGRNDRPSPADSLAPDIPGRPLILLNANASDLLPLRRWPRDRYVDLARRLLERPGEVWIAFTGSPAERKGAERLVAAIASDRCFSMAGATTMRELLVLYCLADVLVTNDSGPAHFAALTPIHTVVLFGPETPARFGSLSGRAHILWKGLDCSPCVTAFNNRLSRCRDNRCMQAITVDEVFSLVCQLLPGPSP